MPKSCVTLPALAGASHTGPLCTTASARHLCFPACSYADMRVFFSHGGGKQKAGPQGHLSAPSTHLFCFPWNKTEDRPVSSRASPAGSSAAPTRPLAVSPHAGSGGSHLPSPPNLPNCCLGHGCEDTGSAHHPPHTRAHHPQKLVVGDCPAFGNFAWHLPRWPAVPQWH